MKKAGMFVLYLLLCFSLCLCGAAGEDVLIEGELEYRIQDLAWTDGKTAMIVGVSLQDGRTEVFFPPELGGYPVAAADLSCLPAYVDTIYVHQSCAGFVPPENRELIQIVYADHGAVTMNADYAALLPDMQEGDYAIMEVLRIRRGENDLQEQSVIPTEEIAAMAFLRQAGEHRIHDAIVKAEKSASPYTFATRPGGRAEIVAFHPAQGQNWVFVPEYWNGLPVFVEGETVPEGIDVVYTPWGGGIIPPAEGRTLTEVFYVSDSDARAYYSDQVKDIRDGDIVLMEVEKYTTQHGECTQVRPAYLEAENALQEVDGRRVNTTALWDGVFAWLTGECRHHAGYGCITVVGAEGVENARDLVIPADFADEPVVMLWMDSFDRNMRTVYVPYGLQLQLEQETDGLQRGTAYALMYYADHAMVMADPALRNVFPDMGEEDFVLVESQVALVNDDQGSVWTMRVGFPSESLPQELRGHALHVHPEYNTGVEIIDFDRLYRGELDAEMADWFGLPEEKAVLTQAAPDENVYAYGELRYMKDHAQQTVSIVGYELAKGQSELFVPSRIDGYSVASIEYEHVPLQIKTLWIGAECGKTILNYGEKPRLHERLTYVYRQTDESSITLDHVTLDSWDQDGNLNSTRQFFDPEIIPDQIAGNTVLFDVTTQGDMTDGPFTTDGWKYYLTIRYTGQAFAHIMDVPQQDWGDTLMLPPVLDGYPVMNIEFEAIPKSVERIILKGNGALSPVGYTDPRDRKLEIVYYTDWEGAADVPFWAGRPEEMQEDDLIWIRAYVHDYASGETVRGVEGTIRADKLPGEIDGYPVIYPKIPDGFLFVSGEWGYTLEDVRDRGTEAVIRAYYGEEQGRTFVLPTELDGYMVAAVEETALSDVVEVVCCLPDTGVWVSRDMILVCFLDYDDFLDTWDSGNTMPEGAEKGDYIWYYAVLQKLMDEGMESVRFPVYVDELPREIDGHRALVSYGNDFLYTCDEWGYSIVPYGGGGALVAWIWRSSFPDGIEEMTVPKELDGYPVNYISYPAIPESVRMIQVPKGCHVREEGATTRRHLKITQYQ